MAKILVLLGPYYRGRAVPALLELRGRAELLNQHPVVHVGAERLRDRGMVRVKPVRGDVGPRAKAPFEPKQRRKQLYWQGRSNGEMGCIRNEFV
jgi:hypothetical protein